MYLYTFAMQMPRNGPMSEAGRTKKNKRQAKYYEENKDNPEFVEKRKKTHAVS